MPEMLINGQMVSTPSTRDVIDPRTETTIEKVPEGSQSDLDTAIKAARTAWASWRNQPQDQRGAILKAMARAVADNAEELARCLVLETGRPLAVAQFEVGLAEQYLSFYAIQTLEPEVLTEDETRRVELRRKPLGVVGAIIPWNAPLYLMTNKIGPALAAGNTIVVKPAPTTPLTALKFAELIAEICPAGVVNIVTGGNDLGAALVSHPDISKITFTGSTETGRKIMASAAPGLKRLTLELGGNDAAIVLPDADIKQIAPGLFGFSFFNSGQVCAVIKRLYVHDSLYEEVCDAMAGMAGMATLGTEGDPAMQFGPVQNKTQYEKVLQFLDQAKRDGKVIAGGAVPEGPGYFVPLTIVRDIKDGTSLVDEEPFGPILPIIRYTDVVDVVERVNASPYGLGASVWSANTDAAAEVASRIESGTVWINQHCALDPLVPFPAHKQSGLGVEGGREGLYAYTALQTVNIAKPQKQEAAA
tara:strand:+ start:337 stop:1758 length:1422 start_codon:yes stop_codon:yes gene_type:complete